MNLEETKICGWSLNDILKVQKWLRNQNAVLADLEDSRLDKHYYSKWRIFDFLKKDFSNEL